LLLFVSLDINPQGFAFFFEGDKSPSFDVGLFFFFLLFALGNHIIECMSWIPLSHVLLSQVFTAELLMGTQSDNL